MIQLIGMEKEFRENLFKNFNKLPYFLKHLLIHFLYGYQKIQLINLKTPRRLIFFITDKGEKIFDMLSGWICTNIGQRHAKVVEAIKKALDSYGCKRSD